MKILEVLIVDDDRDVTIVGFELIEDAVSINAGRIDDRLEVAANVALAGQGLVEARRPTMGTVEGHQPDRHEAGSLSG